MLSLIMRVGYGQAFCLCRTQSTSLWRLGNHLSSESIGSYPIACTLRKSAIFPVDRGIPPKAKRRLIQPPFLCHTTASGQFSTALRWRQMPLQIHAVTQEPKHVDQVFPLGATHPEQDEVPAFASVACNVERPDFAADFGARLDADGVWAGG